MAKRTFLVDIDLDNNQLLAARLENLASDPAGTLGRVYYNTTFNKPKYYDGRWKFFASTEDLADLENVVVGGLVNKGGYDANTNTPLLDVSPIVGIKNGWVYVITANGNFFTEPVQVGDMIIAKQDNPTTLAHWTIVNKNIADIVNSSETERGIIEIATQAEVNAGTDDERAVTPLKLRQSLGITTRKFNQVVGNNTDTSITVFHNLNTDQVIIQVSESVKPSDVVECEMIISGLNSVVLNFNVAPTSNQYQVTIIG